MNSPGAVSVVNPKGTEETGIDRPAAPSSKRQRVTKQQQDAHARGFDEGYEEGRAGGYVALLAGLFFGAMLGGGATALWLVTFAK